MTDKKAPWDKKPPKKRSGNHKMTEAQKEEARARAKSRTSLPQPGR